MESIDKRKSYYIFEFRLDMEENENLKRLIKLGEKLRD